MKIINYLVLIFIGFIFHNCDEGTSPDRVNYVVPDTNISYYKDLLPLFNGRCGFGSNCHSAENPSNFLFFNNKEAFMNYQLSTTGQVLVDQFIHQESPQLAPLYLIVTESSGFAGVERMPPFGYEPLNKNQTDGIRKWIAEGSKD